MKYTKEAVHSLSYLTQDSNEKIATDCSSNSNSNSSCTNVESTPIYQALKGCSLYKHHEKLVSIVDFLRISSHNLISISGHPSIIAKLKTLCETPKLLLKGMSVPSKYPSKWTTHFCAKFICDVVEVIKEDRRLSENKVAIKSTRKCHSSYNLLHLVAFALFNMHIQARLKVQSDTMSRKRKTYSRTKTVKDLLIKSTVHNPELVEVRSEQILDELLCPMCNHRSLVTLTTKADVETRSNLIREGYKRKLNEWSAGGQKGSKPRMGKTENQVLGCVCYMQNCIGNSDGSGCFKCKSDKGDVQKKPDNR